MGTTLQTRHIMNELKEAIEKNSLWDPLEHRQNNSSHSTNTISQPCKMPFGTNVPHTTPIVDRVPHSAREACLFRAIQ